MTGRGRSARRAIVTVAVAAVLAAACSTSSSNRGSQGGSPTSAAGSSSPGHAQLTATARGVTADTIKIGFSYPDLEALAKTGLLRVDNGPYADMIKAITDDVNATGGINGRKLQVFTEKFSVLGVTDQLTACTKFTEDDQVFAVLGGLLGDQNLCLVQQHSTIDISTDAVLLTNDLLAKAKAPWVTWNASAERSLKALAKLLGDQGRLTGKTIVVYGQTPQSQALVDVAKKAIEDAGYKVKDSAINTVDASDAAAFTAQDKIIATRFKDEGADVMILLGGTPTVANYDAADWHPAIYLPTTDLITPGAFTGASLMGKFPIVAAPGASADPNAGYNTPAMQACRAAYQKATGKTIETAAQEEQLGKSTGLAGMLQACTALQIFVTAAKAAGPNLTTATWEKALEGIGSIALPLAPTASFGANKPDGQDSFVLEKHDPTWKPNTDKNEFIPIGTPITLSS
jgi:ABC-type branched-subunit amino acid transport system substrate-binding protein